MKTYQFLLHSILYHLHKANILRHILALLPTPANSDVLIGLGGTPCTTLDASTAAQLSSCANLTGPLSHSSHECQCQSGSSGRYVYVYLGGSPETLHIHEVEIFGTGCMYLISFLFKTYLYFRPIVSAKHKSHFRHIRQVAEWGVKCMWL